MDKVYAVLGLASDGRQIIPRPTYKTSMETVLTDMTKVILMKEKCLDLITLKRPVRDHAEMPSLVPDLTELSKAIGPGQEGRISSSRDADINFEFIGDKLRVRGHSLHLIENATSSRYEGIEVAPMIQSF